MPMPNEQESGSCVQARLTIVGQPPIQSLQTEMIRCWLAWPGTESSLFETTITSDEKAGFNVIDSGSLMFARNAASGNWPLYYDFY